MSTYLFYIILFVIAIASLAMLFYFIPVGLWLAARVSNVDISLLDLVRMRIRRVSPSIIINPLINATQAGLNLSIKDLETHYLSGGNVATVVNALISAQKAAINLSFREASAIDLAGRDVLEAVQTSVKPKVIDTPHVAAMAKDGIQLIISARVTVRTNTKQLIGGAGEDTIIARVGEGIVSSVGQTETHSKVLENPDLISKLVLAKGLDAGTAFEILSIDIADVDVGKNIGAQLQIEQANADKNLAQAEAEKRRAMAIALEQENKAKAEEARANVIQAESEVPMAIAEAFRSGQMGVMDFYRYRNLRADTEMRESIAHSNEVDSSQYDDDFKSNTDKK